MTNVIRETKINNINAVSDRFKMIVHLDKKKRKKNKKY
jgi:hypothetical protein